MYSLLFNKLVLVLLVLLALYKTKVCTYRFIQNLIKSLYDYFKPQWEFYKPTRTVLPCNILYTITTQNTVYIFYILLAQQKHSAFLNC